MKSYLRKIVSTARAISHGTGYENYSENEYGKTARMTDQSYRDRLASWQIPAIKLHFGDLEGKVFIDIGAGDIILGEHLRELGQPQTFYAQDLSRPSLNAGLKRITGASTDSPPFITMSSDNFDFSSIPDRTIDCAFSNSLFSHLSVNSKVLCLRQLAPKMKSTGKYLSSMIVVPDDRETMAFDWSYLDTQGSDVVSHFTKDPFHYSEKSLERLAEFDTGFIVSKVHDYGHPFQRLVEFRLREKTLE